MDRHYTPLQRKLGMHTPAAPKLMATATKATARAARVERLIKLTGQQEQSCDPAASAEFDNFAADIVDKQLRQYGTSRESAANDLADGAPGVAAVLRSRAREVLG